MPDLAVLFDLDVASALLTLLVAVFFGRLAARTGDGLLGLFAAGFALIGVGFVGVSTSQFDTQQPPGAWDGLRIAGQLGGALVLLCSYVSHRVHGSPRPWAVLGGVLAIASGLAAFLFLVVPPFAQWPGLGTVLPVAHALMLACHLACAAMALPSLLRQPSLDRVLVPAAFLAWAASKYTWLLIDLSRDAELAWFVYVWRYLAIAMLLTAIGLGRQAGAGRPHAPA
jgi:hypothetical protein